MFQCFSSEIIFILVLIQVQDLFKTLKSPLVDTCSGAVLHLGRGQSAPILKSCKNFQMIKNAHITTFTLSVSYLSFNITRHMHSACISFFVSYDAM